MADPHYAMHRNVETQPDQLRQRLLSWSQHVASWLDECEFDAHLMRYEDMYLDPLKTFRGACRFTGLDDTLAKVERALAFSSFELLTEQERQHGFGEKRPNTESFFRKGVVGSWRYVLSGSRSTRLSMTTKTSCCVLAI